MESIALLAGGIAHDFNNVLGVIIGYAELALKKVGASHPLSENLTRITQAAQQGAQMVRQLLAFSRRQILSPQDININNLIEGLLKLLGKTLGEHIQLKFIPEEHIHTIHADPVQIEQIVMNLCLNARDAMPEGGQLIIETSNCQLDDEYCKTHAQVKPGDYIMMAVTDTGHGMSKAIQERIFEPFFTTKQPGKGTGLGLSVVHGIVTQHGGFINVYSEVGKGTTFKIYLPSVERPAVARKEMLKEEIPGGSETVLIVEDEAGMRDMMKAVLENLGYSVIAAEDGEQALHLISDNPHRIQLVISDIIVPKIGGKELFEELKSMNFEGQFLFISGYTSNVIHHNFITDKDVEALLKPFSPAELGKKVRALLDRVKR